MIIDLLEDPDGAPYPEEVQRLVRSVVANLGHEPYQLFRDDLVTALESVSKFEEQDRQIDLLLARIQKVQTYLNRCGIMRVEPSTGGLSEALRVDG